MIRFVTLFALIAMLALVACAPKEEAPQEEAVVETMEQAVTARGTLDADADGNVTLEEQKKHATDWFGNIDANDDGIITDDELVARQEESFKRWDANCDGVLTLDEYKLYIAGDNWAEIDTEGIECTVEEPYMKHVQMDSDGDGVATTAERLVFIEKRFEAIDANGDGNVDPAERLAAMQAMFAAMDTNEDGVTVEELVMFRTQ